MKKCFFIITTLITSLHVQCSNSEKFKRLGISKDSRLALPTTEDLRWLKLSRDYDQNKEQELHNLFGRYTLNNYDCMNQKKAYSWGFKGLILYTLAIPYCASTENVFKSCLLAACFVPIIKKCKTISEDWADDQELLVRKCTATFEMPDLEILKQHYQKNKAQVNLEFVNFVIERKKWIEESQNRND